MRKITLATFVSSVLLGAAAQAGDAKWTQEQITAADKDKDGSITLAEATAGVPKLAEKFASVDVNGDGKASADELNAYQKSGDKSMESDEPTTPPKDQ
jgi:Ca2+-binding EF-hand superfamily protein